MNVIRHLPKQNNPIKFFFNCDTRGVNQYSKSNKQVDRSFLPWLNKSLLKNEITIECWKDYYTNVY
jgi:hypothetical protein